MREVVTEGVLTVYSKVETRRYQRADYGHKTDVLLSQLLIYN